MRRVLAESPTLVYEKMAQKPPLTKKHMLARLNFARQYVDFGEKWKNVVFSDEKKYQDLLGEHLLPNGPLITKGSWIFQQDNASVHASYSTRDWFAANNVTVLQWPSRSPDLE